MKPAAMKDGKLYSQQPHSGAGDFNFSRADGVQTRINKHGLIETVADNVPRLSYDLVDGKVSDCPHLLLEPSRYNNLQRSEEFENSYWNKSLISVENNHVSPDGSASADKVVATSSTGAHFFRRTGLNYSASKHTFSIFAKFTDDLYEQFHFVIYDGSNHFAYFDVKNGTLGSADSGVETSITKYPNGWYRCTATYQTNSFSGGQIKVELGSSVSNTGDDSSGVLFWGMMWETGGYPTSYIPTSGSTETRQADICNGSGNSETFNDSEGVLFVETEQFADGDFTSVYISLKNSSDSGFTNALVIQHRNSGELRIYADGSSGNDIQFLLNIDLKQNLKIAVQYKQNNYKLFVNGVEYSIYGVGSSQPELSGLNTVNFNLEGITNSNWLGKVKELTVINETLTDEQLQLLTTP